MMFVWVLVALSFGVCVNASCIGPDGTLYGDGQSFPSSDGCNTCSCQGGFVACTAMACFNGCFYDEQFYNTGDSFTSTDGCNRCSCTDSGLVVCTQRACIPG